MADRKNYVKIQSDWLYAHRAVDREGNTVDFLVRARRNKAAAPIIRKSTQQTGVHETVAIDKSGANLAALHAVNAGRHRTSDIDRTRSHAIGIFRQKFHRIETSRIHNVMVDEWSFASCWAAIPAILQSLTKFIRLAPGDIVAFSFEHALGTGRAARDLAQSTGAATDEISGVFRAHRSKDAHCSWRSGSRRHDHMAHP